MTMSPASISGFQSKSTTVTGVRLHYWIGGDPNGPPVILWHGFLSTSYGWHDVAPALAEAGLAVLVPDMRGFGDSHKPTGNDGYDARSLAEECRALVAAIAFGQGKPLVHAAHDMGALPALMWTSDHAEEVAGLLYIEAPVMLGSASPYQKMLRHLPVITSVFPFIEYGPMQLYLDEGYAYVAMDTPGAGRSEGVLDPVSRTEGEAIHDMIEHVAGLDWSNGRIGMIGMSHYCWSQWNAARTRPPHLLTIAPFDGATDMYRDWMYQGGIPIQGFLNSWLFGSVLLQHMADGLPMTEHGRDRVIYDMYAHPLDDDWQRRRSPFWELDKIDIPVLSIGAWGKAALHLRGNFMGYERVSGPKQLLVTGAASFAETQRLFADADFHREELLPWYDRHLKGVDNAVMGRPAVRFFVQGEDKVREAADWPPPDATPVAFYLSGEKCGHIQSLNDGSLVEAPPGDDGGETSWSYRPQVDGGRHHLRSPGNARPLFKAH